MKLFVFFFLRLSSKIFVCLCRFCCGDMTFEEAYKKTGRVLCITLSSTTKKAPPVLVNYITAPHVTIASAIIASAGEYFISLYFYAWQNDNNFLNLTTCNKTTMI